MNINNFIMGLDRTEYLDSVHFYNTTCLCVRIPRQILDIHNYPNLHKNFSRPSQSDIFYLAKLVNCESMIYLAKLVNYESMMKYA